MGNPEWAKNELFKDYTSRSQFWDALKPLILTGPKTIQWTKFTAAVRQRVGHRRALHRQRYAGGQANGRAGLFFVEAEHPKPVN